MSARFKILTTLAALSLLAAGLPGFAQRGAAGAGQKASQQAGQQLRAPVYQEKWCMSHSHGYLH